MKKKIRWVFTIIIALIFIIQAVVLIVVPTSAILARVITTGKQPFWLSIIFPKYLATWSYENISSGCFIDNLGSKETTLPAISYLVVAYSSQRVDKTKVRHYMDELITQGCDVNAMQLSEKMQPEGLRPIHFAVMYNSPDMAEYLVSKGADPLQKISRKGEPTHNMNAGQYADFLISKRLLPSHNRTRLLKAITPEKAPAQ